MDITIFHNGEAGEGEWPRERILALCRDLKLSPAYLDAKDDASLDRLEKASGPVAVIGGDGTVSKALSRLDRKAVTMLIVPIGGANNIARSLGVHADMATALRSAASAETVGLHVGKLTGGSGSAHFVESVGLGVLVSLVSGDGQDLDPETKREAGRRRLMQALEDAQPLRARILLDGKLLDEPILAFEATNIAMIGPNLPLALRVARPPRSMVACWLREAHREVMHDWLESPDPEHSPFQAVAADRIDIDLDDHSLRVDDALGEHGDRIRLRLRRRPIQVIVPKALP
jgi:diacylglycerol kinase family enzyme